MSNNFEDLLEVSHISPYQIDRIITCAQDIKNAPARYFGLLAGKNIALIFEKPSHRTRVSFEAGITKLGGHVIYLSSQDIMFGKRESIKDIGKVLSRYVDAIVVRTFSHTSVVELAHHADVPVINGLSDLFHPCQALGDMLTIKEKKGKFKGVNLAFIGDGNNVCNSLLMACAKLGVNMTACTPKGCEPPKKVVALAKKFAQKSGAHIRVTNDVAKAAHGQDVLYTDVWVSMGQESERTKKLQSFKGFQINEKIMKRARADAIFMHCLPAHRGEEVSSGILDGKHSVVIDQAENRLYAQQAVLLFLFGKQSF